jgi:hypothetical protein
MEGKIAISGQEMLGTIYTADSLRKVADSHDFLFIKEGENGQVELWSRIKLDMPQGGSVGVGNKLSMVQELLLGSHATYEVNQRMTTAYVKTPLNNDDDKI